MPHAGDVFSRQRHARSERFYETGRTVNGLVMLPDCPIKTFMLRGIKDSPLIYTTGACARSPMR
jgi:hypothetical protein